MASLPWTKVYWADFLGDTLALDAEEIGMYWLLLAHYYQTGGPIPDDSMVLWRITRATTTGQRKKLAGLLKNYFVMCEGKWWSNRAEKEIRNRKKQVENGKKGGRPSLRVAK